MAEGSPSKNIHNSEIVALSFNAALAADAKTLPSVAL
jgi:hypothetical protein